MVPRLPLRILRMHGCGNSYVFVDGFHGPLPENPVGLARRLCHDDTTDRPDGLVVMQPAEVATGRMSMWNADGSEGLLCGNALRCMALWLHQLGMAGDDLVIEMNGRHQTIRLLQSDPAGGCGLVSVRIPLPTDGAPDAPPGQAAELTPGRVRMPAEVIDCWQVSVGNPHLILFVSTLTGLPVETLGPLLETDPRFPDRTNVEFVEVLDRSTARVRVWERGSGLTQACGSGACAVAVAGMALEHFDRQPVQILMPGGSLTVEWSEPGILTLTGPAQRMSEGTLMEETAQPGDAGF